jgi:Zn-dependent protease
VTRCGPRPSPVGRYTEGVTGTTGDRLEELAGRSLQYLSNGEYGAARDVLGALAGDLPPESPIRAGIFQAISTLTLHLTAGSAPPPQLIERLASLARQAVSRPPAVPLKPRNTSASAAKKLGPIGVVLAFLTKFKTVALLLATKGKLLLMGLTNIKALFSILAFVGVYWALYGWWFAVGFFGSVFIHEMGHYVTVRRYGFAASAPIFIPGVAAFVRWQGANVTPDVRARIALAGPLFGLGAAVVSYLIFTATGAGVWLAVAHTGAFLNLLNLIPVFIFDGGGAFIALGRQERMAVLIISIALWFFLGEFIFLFIGLGAGYRLIRKDHPLQGSQLIGYYFIGLLIALGLLDWWMLQTASATLPVYGYGTRTMGGYL